MRALLLIPALAVLAACGARDSRETYTCPNGPDLVAVYSEDTVSLTFPDGRVEVLTRADPAKPDIYAKPGMVWDASAFRNARLTDETSSYLCDQMEG